MQLASTCYSAGCIVYADACVGLIFFQPTHVTSSFSPFWFTFTSLSAHTSSLEDRMRFLIPIRWWRQSSSRSSRRSKVGEEGAHLMVIDAWKTQVQSGVGDIKGKLTLNPHLYFFCVCNFPTWDLEGCKNGWVFPHVSSCIPSLFVSNLDHSICAGVLTWTLGCAKWSQNSWLFIWCANHGSLTVSNLRNATWTCWD